MNVEHEHPPYTGLSDYALEELSEERLAEVEEHLLICERCRQVVSELDVFVPVLQPRGVMQVTAAFTHAFGDRGVSLELRRLPDHKWGARYFGSAAQQSGIFKTAAEAHAFLRQVFEEQYPDHLCTERCGPAAN